LFKLKIVQTQKLFKIENYSSNSKLFEKQKTSRTSELGEKNLQKKIQKA
jgi:hypothetical protein